MFFVAERNVISVEIQAFRNLTYNVARYKHGEGPRLNQKINSILLSSHWRSKSCSTTPPSNICHSPAASSFRPIPSSLVNSSSLIPKTRPNRSVRESVIRTRARSLVCYSKNTLRLHVSSMAVMRRGPVSGLETFRPSGTFTTRRCGSARNSCRFARLVDAFGD